MLEEAVSLANKLRLLLALAQPCSQLGKELELLETFDSAGQSLNCDLTDVNRLESLLNMVKPVNHLKEVLIHLTMALPTILIKHPAESLSSAVLTRSPTLLIEYSRLSIIFVD